MASNGHTNTCHICSIIRRLLENTVRLELCDMYAIRIWLQNAETLYPRSKCLLTAQLLWKSLSTWFIVAESRGTWFPSTLQAWVGEEVCYLAPVCVNSWYSSVSLHNPSGREDNVLLLTYKYCKLVMFPIVSGRDDNWLLSANNPFKLVMFPIVDGREDNWLL